MSSLLFGARMLLVAVLATAGVAKLLDRAGSRRALAGFGVPMAALPVAAVALPLAELATALLLIPPATAQWAGIAALALLLVFIAAISNAMRHGAAPDCHCFGQLHSAPAGRGTLARNFALAVPAGFVVVAGPGPSVSTWVADRTAAELVAVAAVLAAVALGAHAARLSRRLNALRNAFSDVRAELESLPPSLPIGAKAPDFSLRSVHGGTVTLEELCARGRSVALVFVSPTCGSCETVFTAAARWQTALASDLTVAIVSDGEPAANLVAAGNSDADVLLQEKWEVGEAYRVRATPTVIMVSPRQRIASGFVFSGPALESLIRLHARQHASGRSTGETSAAQPVA